MPGLLVLVTCQPHSDGSPLSFLYFPKMVNFSFNLVDIHLQSGSNSGWKEIKS